MVARVHSGSLSWLYICLHDTITKCHAGTSHPGVSSPRLLYQSKNLTPVWNFTLVSCKCEMTTRLGDKSVCRWIGTDRACAMFAILNCTYILSTWSVASNKQDMKWHKRDMKSKSYPGTCMRVLMGWWLLRLLAKILALLRLSVNFFQLRLTKKLKINFFCFKKLNIN